MAGVGVLNQPHIPVGQTFVYEFEARRPGTFMYHPHADEMVQMAMGMMGMWVTHPKTVHPHISEVDRDFCFLLNAFDVEPGSKTPKVNTMLDFNIWCWNSRVFPAIDTLNVRLNDRVRIRVGNLTMTNHPIHLHGHEFLVTERELKEHYEEMKKFSGMEHDEPNKISLKPGQKGRSDLAIHPTRRCALCLSARRPL